MKVFESARFCTENNTYWPPNEKTGMLVPFSNHSYFRIRDLATGAVVSNVQGSQSFAYGSAVVDPVTRKAWVFGSPRDLCHHAKDPPNPNFVQAWWSDDLVTWHTATGPALSLPAYPFNMDVTPVVNVTLNGTSINFVMVLENGRIAVHTAADRNLSKGWVVHHSKSKGFGECPAVHYGEEDGYFYVISGGRTIALARTKNLNDWVKAKDLVAADADLDSKVSPFLDMEAQVNGKTPGSDQKAAANLRNVLANPYCWEFNVNDADFCCGSKETAPGAPLNKSYVLYSPSSQGAKALDNCTALGLRSTDFNGIAMADVSLTQLLSSRFD
jgi:hypothetical protein